MRRRAYFFLLLIVVLLIGGCNGRKTITFVREDVTLDFVKRVAVLPLQNNTDEKYASELARDVINTKILEMNLFDAVDKGIVDSVLYEEAVDAGSPVSQMMLSRLGQRLSVQALMIGSVDIAGDNRIGSVSVPQMSLTLRLIEVKSGLVLWQGSGHYAGDSIIGRLFGIIPDDRYMVAAKLVDKLLRTIPAEAGGETVLPVTEQPVDDDKKETGPKS
ncbi:MAG: hypothetical protein V1706_06780 [Pseudomonadota bacterium]